MNLTNRTEVTSEIHHSLHTIVVHACEFVEQALVQSINVPIFLLVQSQRKIVQGNFPSSMEIFGGSDSKILIMTSAAKGLATCREALGLALIYGTRLATGPGTGKTDWERFFGPRPEKEVAIVKAESCERKIF